MPIYKIRKRDGTIKFTDEYSQGAKRWDKLSRTLSQSEGERKRRAKAMLDEKYRKRKEEVQKKLEKAEKMLSWHQKMQRECDKEYSRMIEKNRALLEKQNICEAVFKSMGIAVSFGAGLKSAWKSYSRHRHWDKTAKKLIDTKPRTRPIDSVALKRAQRLKDFHSKKIDHEVARNLAVTVGKQMGNEAIQLTKDELDLKSPLMDAADILWNLSPAGSNPTAVAKSALRLYGDVDVDEAKREHAKMIEAMGWARAEAIAYHRVQAMFLEGEIVSYRFDLQIGIRKDYIKEQLENR